MLSTSTLGTVPLPGYRCDCLLIFPNGERLMRAMKEKGVYYIPTLDLDESFYLYADHPEWLNDSFLAGALNPGLRMMLSSRASRW
jgi:hypothetical protein